MRAVDWAADEAALRGVPLRLVYASLWERYEGAALAEGLGRSSEQVLADNIVEAAAKRAHRREADLKISTEVAARGAGARTAAGGAERLRTGPGHRAAAAGSPSCCSARSASRWPPAPDCPVIVLRGSHDRQASPGCAGASCSESVRSPQNSAAVRFAFEEARNAGLPLEAVRAWRCPAHETTDHPLLAGRTRPLARAAGHGDPGSGAA